MHYLQAIENISSTNHKLRLHCKALLADIRARHPGEDLKCDHLKAIDEIVNTKPICSAPVIGQFDLCDTEKDILREAYNGTLQWGAAVGVVWPNLARHGLVERNFGPVTQKGIQYLSSLDGDE